MKIEYAIELLKEKAIQKNNLVSVTDNMYDRTILLGEVSGLEHAVYLLTGSKKFSATQITR